MKRIASLILAIVFVFSTFNYGHALSINVQYLDVKIGTSKGITDEIKITNYNSSDKLALYDGNRKNLKDLDSSVSIKYDSATKKFKIYDSKDRAIATIDPGKGNIIGSPDKGVIKVDGKSYRDYVYFVINSNKIDIVNHIQLEKYLYGVVPREMPTYSTGIEALKAQAVTARSFAVRNKDKHRSLGYGLCDTTDCQVYGGYDGEADKANQAVNATKDEVVTYNGSIIATYYHANSGGHTEDAGKVWSSDVPYCKGVPDNYSKGAYGYEWNYTITFSEMENRLKSKGHDVGTLRDVQVTSRTASNRAYRVKLIGSKGFKEITGDQFRGAIGYSYLKSTMFNMEKSGGTLQGSISILDRLGKILSKALSGLSVIGKDGKVTTISNPVVVIDASGTKRTLGQKTNPTQIKFTGNGYGHGVGMSQYGAINMAASGKTYKQIITHYYTNVKIEKINQ